LPRVTLHNLTIFSAMYACLSARLELLSSGSVKSGARKRLPMRGGAVSITADFSGGSCGARQGEMTCLTPQVTGGF